MKSLSSYIDHLLIFNSNIQRIFIS